MRGRWLWCRHAGSNVHTKGKTENTPTDGKRVSAGVNKTVAVAVVGAIVCSGPAYAAGSKKIVFARAQDADSLDPARVSTTISLQAMTQIYDNLLTMDANGKLHPGLASEWKESDDAKTFTFKIRQVKCHDGSM